MPELTGQACLAPTGTLVIGSFKSAASKNINKLNNRSFKWQRSFYDHGIRNEESLQNVRQYIINNPGTWADDENNKKNHKLTGQACLAPAGMFGSKKGCMIWRDVVVSNNPEGAEFHGLAVGIYGGGMEDDTRIQRGD